MISQGRGTLSSKMPRLTFSHKRCHALDHVPQILVFLEQVADQKDHQLDPLLLVTGQDFDSCLEVAYLYMMSKSK